MRGYLKLYKKLHNNNIVDIDLIVYNPLQNIYIEIDANICGPIFHSTLQMFGRDGSNNKKKKKKL